MTKNSFINPSLIKSTLSQVKHISKENHIFQQKVIILFDNFISSLIFN